MDKTLGSLFLFAGDFAPYGTALCDGSLVAIDSNQALYSVLGTMYGGDGVTTFALPDLRGRTPVHTTSTLGETTTGVTPASGSSTTLPGSVYLNWCIATTGDYPGRS